MKVAVAPRLLLLPLALACSVGTEPSTNPREQRADPAETGQVSGRVITSGLVQAPGARAVDQADSAAGRWVEFGPLAGEAIRHSQSLRGVVVELGILHFERSSDSAGAGAARSRVAPIAVPDVWVGPTPRFLEPGPAAPPGRFEVIARATTNSRGEFRFSRAPRGPTLVLRVRPPAPYLETYSHSPFWLSGQEGKVVDVAVRRLAPD